MSRPEPGEPFTAGTNEYRLVLGRTETALATEAAKDRGEIGGEWDDPLFPSLPVEEDLARSFEPQVGGVDADRLGDTSSGPSEEEQQCPVATSLLRGPVRSLEQGGQVSVTEMWGHSRRRALRRDRQHALRDPEGTGVTCSNMSKERADSCQSRVARLRSVAALPLEVFEKGEHDVAVEITEGECMGPAAGSLSGEQNKQPERVSIARHRGRSGVSLTDKSLAEERFEKLRER